MYVYVIECEGIYKVGKARNPEKRVRELQIGCPYPLTIVAHYEAGHDGAAHDAEGRAHERLAAFRWRGRREWFKAPLTVVLAEVSAAVGGVRPVLKRTAADLLPATANGVALTYN